MNAADRRFLKELQKKVDETHGDVKFIRYEMPVNGVKGIEKGITHIHNEVKETKTRVAGLEDKIGLVWAATARWRARIDLMKSFKVWANVHPVLGFIVNALTGRVAKYLLFGLIGLVISTIGIEAIVGVFSKFLTFILGQFTK